MLLNILFNTQNKINNTQCNTNNCKQTKKNPLKETKETKRDERKHKSTPTKFPVALVFVLGVGVITNNATARVHERENRSVLYLVINLSSTFLIIEKC